MSFNLTVDMVTQLLPKSKEIIEWHAAFCEVLPKFNINTEFRVAGFIAQCAHESAGFTILQENLNYSADSLLRVFPKYFKDVSPADYARQPEKIASRVYGGRMGNGPESTKDGWKYRGRGPIQLTGKDNYTSCSMDVFGDLRLVENPDLVLSDKVTTLSTAAWFWKKNGLNALADAADIVGMTKRINGGVIGLEDRKKHYHHAIDVLRGKHSSEPTTIVYETVKLGSTGPMVAKVQTALGISADGNFGPGTSAAVKQWQAKNGLDPDGVVGPKSLAILLK